MTKQEIRKLLSKKEKLEYSIKNLDHLIEANNHPHKTPSLESNRVLKMNELDEVQSKLDTLSQEEIESAKEI